MQSAADKQAPSSLSASTLAHDIFLLGLRAQREKKTQHRLCQQSSRKAERDRKSSCFEKFDGNKGSEPHVEISDNPIHKRDRCRGSSFGRRLVCIQTGQETSWSPAALAEARVGSRFKRKYRYFVEGNLIVILEPFPKLLTDGLLFLIGLTTRLCSLLCVVVHVDGLEPRNTK